MKKKICSKCKIEKPFDQYFKDNNRKIGIRSRCKACCSLDIKDWRDRHRSEYNNYSAMWRAKNPEKQHATEIKRRYKLSKEQYEEMLKKQNYGCDCCGEKHNPKKKRGRLYVDHDHETGEVRGLLCSKCNLILGHFDYNLALLQRALDYINLYKD